MRQWIFRSYWMMVAVLILAALLLTVGTTLAQPPVPHGVIEGDDCLSCHEAGVADAPRLSRDHMGRRNEDCALCHQASGAFAGDIPHSLAGREDCLSCHGLGTGTMLGKSHVDYTNDECSLCHLPSAVVAAESNPAPEKPHIVTGGNACVSCHQLSFVEWSLEMDCGGACHTMEPYVDSLQDADLLAYAHAQEGLVCQDCHEAAVLEEVHEGTTDPNVTELKPRMFPDEFCFDCHVPNEHTSYEEIVARTEDYTVNDEKVNPHDPHAGVERSDIEQTECSRCHQMHKESRGINYCYNACHHERNFENCNACH